MQDLKAIKARAQSIRLCGPDSKTSGPQAPRTTKWTCASYDATAEQNQRPLEVTHGRRK